MSETEHGRMILNLQLISARFYDSTYRIFYLISSYMAYRTANLIMLLRLLYLNLILNGMMILFWQIQCSDLISDLSVLLMNPI